MINNEGIKKMTLVFQDVMGKSEDETLTAMFGMIELEPVGKKKKGERINFISRLSEVPAFEKHINRIIKEATNLKQDETK